MKGTARTREWPSGEPISPNPPAGGHKILFIFSSLSIIFADFSLTDTSVLGRRQHVSIVALASERAVHVGAVSVRAHARVLTLVVVCKIYFRSSIMFV